MSNWVRDGIWVRAREGTYFDTQPTLPGRQKLPREIGVVRQALVGSPHLWSVDNALYNSNAKLAEEWEPIVDARPDGTYPESPHEIITRFLGYRLKDDAMVKLVDELKDAFK